MGLVNQTLPGLYNGVSQQPDELRLDTQVSEMINCYPSLVEGTQKRLPAVRVSVDNTMPADVFVHTYDRGYGDESYILTIKDGAWKAFDADTGVAINGMSWETDSYLDIPTGTKASEAFSMVTVGDTTYVVNKHKVVDLVGGVSSSVSNINWFYDCSSFIVQAVLVGDASCGTYTPVRYVVDATVNLQIVANGTTYTQAVDLDYSECMSAATGGAGLLNEFSLVIKQGISTLLTTVANAQSSITKIDDLTLQGDSSTMSTTDITFSHTVSYTTGSFHSGGITSQVQEPGDWEQAFYYWVKRTAGGTSGDNTGLRYTYYVYSGTSSSPIASVITHDATVAASSLASSIGGIAKGSVVRKVLPVGTRYSGSDSWGDQASRSWQAKIKKLQDLPNNLGFEGAIIEITGDESSGFDNYYVEYSDGVYKETVRPGLQNHIDTTTMPHVMVRGQASNGDIKFYMKPANYSEISPFTDDFGNDIILDRWEARGMGDTDSAPVPSFVGKTLQDVFFYKNRLGLLSGDNVIMSETGAYYNFFPTTVTDVLDSDPIDVAVDSNHAVHLSYAMPFNKELLIFGNKAQFTLSAAKALSPKDVNIQQSTAYTINSKVAPTTLGPNIYFATGKANSSIVREYYVVPDTTNNTAANITAHCPSYVPNGLIKLVGSEKHDMLFGITGTDNKIYVYNFYWQGEEKSQSAWHTWSIESDEVIFSVEVLGSKLLVMVSYPNGDKALESIDLELPKDISTIDYKDDGTAPVESRIEMSKWGVPSGQSNVDSNRSSLILRDLRLSMGDNSYYGVEVTRGAVVNTWLNYETTGMTFIGDHKYPVVGNANNLGIAIVNDTNKGFKLNSLSWRGQLHLKGSRGI